MSIRQLRLRAAILSVTLGIVACFSWHWLLAFAPNRPHLSEDIRTYRFKARIEKNAGITPLKVGQTITGQFTYDLKAKNKYPEKTEHGSYQSVGNTISFQSGEFRFSGAGDITVNLGRYKHAEHFQIVAFDLALPKGWEMDHTRRSQTYGIVLQNAPAKNILADTSIPKHLVLADFQNTRELRLDFFHGVTFPGGQVQGRATVRATVEELKEVAEVQ